MKWKFLGKKTLDLTNFEINYLKAIKIKVMNKFFKKYLCQLQENLWEDNFEIAQLRISTNNSE